jgi:hypothetical protein
MGEDQDTIQKTTGDSPVTMEYIMAQHAAKFGLSQSCTSVRQEDSKDDPILQSHLVHANVCTIMPSCHVSDVSHL